MPTTLGTLLVTASTSSTGGVDGIEEAGAGPAKCRVQHAQDGERDEKADDRVSGSPPERHAARAREHGEAGRPVRN